MSQLMVIIIGCYWHLWFYIQVLAFPIYFLIFWSCSTHYVELNNRIFSYFSFSFFFFYYSCFDPKCRVEFKGLNPHFSPFRHQLSILKKKLILFTLNVLLCEWWKIDSMKKVDCIKCLFIRYNKSTLHLNYF